MDQFKRRNTFAHQEHQQNQLKAEMGPRAEQVGVNCIREENGSHHYGNDGHV